jgi:hypothetical protein
MALLRCHESQILKTNVAGMNIGDYAKSAAIFRGSQNRSKFAEGFVPLRMSLKLVAGCEL